VDREAKAAQTKFVQAMYTSIKGSFVVESTTDAVIAFLDERRSKSIIEDVLQKLAEDVLEGRNPETDERYISRYSTFNPDPARVVRRRVALVKSLRLNGQYEPIEILFDNRGTRLVNGRHRLNFLHYMPSSFVGEKNVSVRVCLCSDELAAVAALIDKEYTRPGLVTYQPIPHPAFAFHRVLNYQLPLKVDAIALRADRAAPFVDFGCHLGYAVRRLQSAGLRGCGVEYQRKYVDIQASMEAIGASRVDVRATSILQFMRDNPDFNCTPIFLSVIHHFLKTSKGMDQVRDIIVPWVRRNSATAFVEHHYEDTYPVRNVKETVAFWGALGLRAEIIDYASEYWLGRRLFLLAVV